jgi:hypothetical protein
MVLVVFTGILPSCKVNSLRKYIEFYFNYVDGDYIDDPKLIPHAAFLVEFQYRI